MQGTNRGMARVSLTWVIFLVVITLVAIVFGYISQDDLSRAKAELRSAQTKEAEAEVRATEVDNARRDAVGFVGFYDREDLSQTLNLELAQAAIADLASEFPDLPPDAKTVQDLLPAISAERKKLVQAVESLRSDVQRLQSELQTEQDARTRDLAEKDTLIADLRGQLSDEQDNAEARQTELEDRLSTVEQQADELDTQKRQLERDLEEITRAAERNAENLAAIIADKSRRLAFMEGEAAEVKDGNVTAVSRELGVAWIDIGSHDRVVPGLTFTIRDGQGSGGVKAEGRVVEVETDLAKLELGPLADPFRPVVAGDEVFNPVFDPTGERFAVLAGRFAGALDESEVKLVLANMGVTVQSNISASTDMLILGGELVTDEYGDPLEEPMSPTELPIYSEAQARGVEVVPYNVLRKFVQF